MESENQTLFIDDRVRLSAEGRKAFPNTKNPGRRATVAGYGREPGTVRILWDGTTEKQTYDASFFELASDHAEDSAVSAPSETPDGGKRG